MVGYNIYAFFLFMVNENVKINNLFKLIIPVYILITGIVSSLQNHL